MINNIFEFDDLNAGDIMTHRTDIDAVDINDSIEEAVKLSICEGLAGTDWLYGYFRFSGASFFAGGIVCAGNGKV